MIEGRGLKQRLRDGWPWLAMMAVAVAAFWHARDFSEVEDREFPGLIRPHFNDRPPAMFRLSEPGDTLDRIGLYFSAGGFVFAFFGLASRLSRKNTTPENGLGLWPSAVAVSAGLVWYSATPGPCIDGWWGWGWRALLEPNTPSDVRLILLGSASAIAGVLAWNLFKVWPDRREIVKTGRDRGSIALLILSAALVAFRQFDWGFAAPADYWPKCAHDLGVLAFGLAILRSGPSAGGRARIPVKLAVVAGWACLVICGIGIAKVHRPLARLRPVVPGRIYISAMPTYRGLAIEQERLHFKTIINLFDESSTQASPYHAEEIRFVREHGLRYVGSPSDGMESDRFFDETMKLAQDPDAWPILVHCHGCMDRSPAWMGLYRFLVQGRPLDAIYREIEQHRGSRPKGVVTLQYIRKLSKRVPEMFAADPTSAILLRCARGVADPFERLTKDPNRTDRQVVRRIDPDASVRRP